MYDFHTHILPGVDDGSKSVDESMAMLDSMQKQGIKTVIATPHFYANDESVDDFINRRNAAYEALKENIPNNIKVALGAEVRYYDGISRLADLKKLQIQDSKFLLLEMPFNQWTEYAIREVVDIAGRGMITLVLAHIERYMHMQKKGVLPRLLENGVLFQANASFFTERRYRSQAIKMIKNNQIHFIGSDCHNLSDRAPNTAEAFQIMNKKLGCDFVENYLQYEDELFLLNQKK